MNDPLSNINSIEMKVALLKAEFGDSDTLYREDIVGYIRDKLGVTLWESEIGQSQADIARSIQDILLKQYERQQHELGLIQESDLRFWKVGEYIPYVVSINSGHNTGKSYLLSCIAVWMYDVWDDSITYTISPSKMQASAITWRNIRSLFSQSNVEGKLLELSIKNQTNPENFVTNRTVPRSKSSSTESVHGLHPIGPFLSILDEAQAYFKNLFNALESILSNGFGVLVTASNPRDSMAIANVYRTYKQSVNYTLNCLNHPNVIHNASVVEGGITRAYIDHLLTECEPVAEHDITKDTFTMPYGDTEQIYVPSNQFRWRVLGIPSAHTTGNTFFTSRMIERALEGEPILNDPVGVARIGVDVARFGSDTGTIYWRGRGAVQHHATVSFGDSSVYIKAIEKLLDKLHQDKYTDIQVRLDSTGGYASGIEDFLNKNRKWSNLFKYFEIIPVSFRSTAFDEQSYYDIVTEMYDRCARVFNKGLKLDGYIDENLTIELAYRTYDYTSLSGAAFKRLSQHRIRDLEKTEVKRISKKSAFKSLYGHSPDHADGLVLAVCPDPVLSKFRTQRRLVNVVDEYRKVSRAKQKIRSMLIK